MTILNVIPPRLPGRVGDEPASLSFGNLDKGLYHGGVELRPGAAPELGDDRTRWSFALVRPSSRHRLAVAASVGADVALTLRHARCVPLRGVVGQR